PPSRAGSASAARPATASSWPRQTRVARRGRARRPTCRVNATSESSCPGSRRRCSARRGAAAARAVSVRAESARGRQAPPGEAPPSGGGAPPAPRRGGGAPADAEGAPPGPPRPAARLPGAQPVVDEERAAGEVDLRVGPREVEARGDLPPLQGEHGLDQAGD